MHTSTFGSTPFVWTAALAVCAAVSLAAVAPAKSEGFGFASFSATVAANGKTLRSSGVKKSTHPASGQYILQFNRPVNTCTYLAGPIGDAGGQASVQQGSKKGWLEVRTFNKAGNAGNLAFAVTVTCAS